MVFLSLDGIPLLNLFSLSLSLLDSAKLKNPWVLSVESVEPHVKALVDLVNDFATLAREVLYFTNPVFSIKVMLFALGSPPPNLSIDPIWMQQLFPLTLLFFLMSLCRPLWQSGCCQWLAICSLAPCSSILVSWLTSSSSFVSKKKKKSRWQTKTSHSHSFSSWIVVLLQQCSWRCSFGQGSTLKSRTILIVCTRWPSRSSTFTMAWPFPRSLPCPGKRRRRKSKKSETEKKKVSKWAFPILAFSCLSFSFFKRSKQNDLTFQCATFNKQQQQIKMISF